MNKFFKNKKIIISAGPVWVPIDQVRVITNVFGGALGYIIAEEASKRGAEVFFVVGPGRIIYSGKEKFKIKKFKYYEEIYKILKNEISKKKYDIIIHSAAIPDYLPSKKEKGKIKSGNKNLMISFKPTKKIIDQFRKWDPDIFIVKFKLEVGKSEKALTQIAYKSMVHSHADLMVANEIKQIGSNHKAFIINKDKKITKIIGKQKIAKKLMDLIEENYNTSL